jgi:hypothetical protein
MKTADPRCLAQMHGYELFSKDGKGRVRHRWRTYKKNAQGLKEPIDHEEVFDLGPEGFTGKKGTEAYGFLVLSYKEWTEWVMANSH